MNIKYIIETISPDGRRDCTVKEFDKPEIIIGRGSASDILFTSRQVSFKHARLRLIEGKIFVEDLGSSCGIRVNDKIISRAFLKAGDILKVGDISLKVTFWDEVWKEGDEALKGTFENEVWELIETRKEEKREEGKISAQRLSDKFEVTNLPSYRVITLALIVPILLFFLVAPLLGVNEISWSSGPISKAHQFMKKDCAVCHQNTFEKVQGKVCATCHAMGEHSKILAENPQFNKTCVTCHEEHGPYDRMIPKESALCISCHANIRAMDPKSKSPAITGFNKTHPEAAKIRHGWVDRAGIKFNHRYHLTKTEVTEPPDKKRSMKCEDCHIPDSSGAYMKPITFNEVCSKCHKLGFGLDVRTFPILHSQPTIIRAFLKSPGELLMSAQKSKRQWTQADMQKNEHSILFFGKESCVHCHFLDVEPVAGVSPTSSLAAFSLWDHDVRLWDIASGKDKARLKGHEDVVNSVQFSPDGNRLVTASRDFTARVWNLSAPEEPPLVLRKHTGSVNSAGFNSAQDKIITASSDNTAMIWDIVSQTVIHTLKKHSRPVRQASFNKDATRAVTLAADHTAILWDAETGNVLADNLNPEFRDVLDVAFSPDGDKLAGAISDGSIKIWNAVDGKELQTLARGQGDLSFGHSKEVTAITFSPDGSKLLSISKDQSAKIWNLRQAAVQTTLLVYEKGEEKKIAPQRFLTAAFNPDGSQVVTGSTDKLVRLWDTESGRMLAKMKGHKNRIHTVLFDQQGARVLAVADNNKVAIWEVPPASPKTQVLWFYDTTHELKHGELGRPDEELRLPNVLPTHIPARFFEKGLFNHQKHQYLNCNTCHEQAKESLSTTDVLISPITVCHTCHEKAGVQLNQCVHCHMYHPEKERRMRPGNTVLDDTAPLGYAFSRKEPTDNGS